MKRRVAGDRRGTTALEVAIVMPAFMTLVFGMFDVGRAVWTYASLQAGADNAARCYAMQQTCTTATNTASYISNIVGFTVPSSALTITTSANCGSGITGTQVAISTSFSFIAPRLFNPSASATMSVSGCYPT